MRGEIVEAATKDGPGLLGGNVRNYSEFEAQAQALAARFKVSIELARLTVRLLRGGAE